MRIHVVALVGLLSANLSAQSDVAYQLSEADLIPEGIAYDNRQSALFVGSTYKRKVVRIAPDGSVTDFITEGEAGIWGVVGMDVDQARHVLWVASSHAGAGMPMINMDLDEEGYSGLFGWDTRTGELVAKHTFTDEENRFLNDVIAARNGDVFVTDSRNRKLLRRSHADMTIGDYLDVSKFGSPNGLCLNDGGERMYVAVGNRIVVHGMASGSVQLLDMPDDLDMSVIDGLSCVDSSLLAVQPFNDGQYVIRLDLSNNGSEVLSVARLLTDHPSLNQPTTGVVDNGSFYLVANSQLQLFRTEFARSRLAGEEESISTLVGPVILRIAIDQSVRDFH